MKVPFENSLLILTEKWIENPEESEKIKPLIDTLKTLISKYKQMQTTSMACYEELMRNLNTQKEVSLSIKEYSDQQSFSIDAKCNYLSFIEELNRCGRILKKELKIDIPHYNRIKFYRNKAIEHIEDFNSHCSYASHIRKERIVIPTHFGTFNTAESKRQVGYNKIRIWFKKHLIEIPETMPLVTDEEYSNIIYSYLEKINCYWGKKSIEKEFVNDLFKFKFPTPIFNIEEYCANLSKIISKKVNIFY